MSYKPTESEPPESAWRRVENLLRYRAYLLRDLAQKNSAGLSVKLQEVESNIYERIFPLLTSMVSAMIRGKMPEEPMEGLVNDALTRIFAAYAQFEQRSSFKTYVMAIVKNLVSDSIKKMTNERNLLVHDDERLRAAADKAALQSYHEQETGAASLARDVIKQDDLFALIDYQEQNLTDRELLAVILKLVSTRLNRKLKDEDLARLLGMKRTAFLSNFTRGRDKIWSYLKEKMTRGE